MDVTGVKFGNGLVMDAVSGLVESVAGSSPVTTINALVQGRQ